MFWKKKKKTVKIKRYKPYFKTLDGVEHEGLDWYKWLCDDGSFHPLDQLMCDIGGNYLMDINSEAYLLDKILSVKWELLEEKTVIDNFDHKYF